ncbi:unnamed protein product [Larinioides sclopetarius]|uniref:Uncharacterized protein n=1 Tax=Larinioides sclopetarius TaxID=280406 RepID=A0AAV2C177_9ARAC
MAYLAKARKDDLKTLATELGLQVNDTMRVIDLKDLIVKSETYDEIFTKNLLETLIETRQQQENDHKNLEERKRKEQDLLFEIERLKLNLAAVGSSPNLGASASNVNIETHIQQLVPKFTNTSDIASYLQLFERQCETLNVLGYFTSPTNEGEFQRQPRNN